MLKDNIEIAIKWCINWKFFRANVTYMQWYVTLEYWRYQIINKNKIFINYLFLLKFKI